MSTRIRELWLSHPEYWIATGKEQATVDRILYDAFFKYNIAKEDVLGQVLYFDQLMRHFSRVEPISEDFLLSCRKTAAHIVESLDSLLFTTEAELIWYLMPWKHLQEWTLLFEHIDCWLKGRPLVMFPLLNRFFMDSYRKAYTPTRVKESIRLIEEPIKYDAIALCESHPTLYESTVWPSLPCPTTAKPLLVALP